MNAMESLARRARRYGAGSLEDAELLALLLGRARPGGLPRRLLARFGSVGSLWRTPPPEIEADFGPVLWARLQAARELQHRCLEEGLQRGPVLASPADTERYLRSLLGGLDHERFLCLHLDNRHRLIRRETLFRGTLDGASVYPREVVKSALAHNAAAVILAHNHPSGVAEPSAADEHITRRLKAALGLVDIRLLDHLVVTHGGCVSLAARGLL